MVNTNVLAKKLGEKLFGSSGIRGVVNKELTLQLALQTGLAVATMKEMGKIIIAHDTRTSAKMIEDAVVAGLLAGGAQVIKLGMVPTPVLAYATRLFKTDGGIMITASHNPPQYNGIKLFNPNTMAYAEKQQDKIEQLIKKQQFTRQTYQKIGTITTADASSLYIETLGKAVKLQKKWRVVLDPGNGATCHIALAVFQALGCKTSTINAQPDGHFPARSAEPTPESLVELCKMVREFKVDIGFAYDGDGDRMVAVTETGEFAPFDQTLAAYAGYAVKENRGGSVITTVEASMCVEKMVQKHRGKVYRTRVGDVAVAEEVKERKAIFGGEPCGAWIHPQFHYCPDGVLSSVLLLKALEKRKKSLSEFIAEVPPYPVMKKSLDCPNNAKAIVMQRIRMVLPSAFPRAEVTDIDGMRLAFANGWVLIRASGTEPLIRVKVEAENDRDAERIMRKCVKIVSKIVKEADK